MKQYYAKGQYNKVIEEAKRSFSEYNNPNLHLLWAKSAYKLGKTDEAMSAYERVLILNPDNKEAQSSLNLLYKKSKRNNLDIALLDEKNQNIKASANFALGYDNNINTNPGSLAINNYFGFNIGGNQKRSSRFLRFSTDYEYTSYFDNYPGWFVRGIFDFYNQSNFSAHYYDLRLATMGMEIGYEKDTYAFYMPIRYSHLHYLNENLLRTYTFAPHISFPVFESSLWDINILYKQRLYIDSAKNINDANIAGIGTGFYFPLYGSKGSVHFQYEKRTPRQSNANTYIDAAFFRFDATLQHYFTPTLSLDINYFYRHGDYNDNLSTFLFTNLTHRKDIFNQLDTKLVYNLSKKYALYIQDSYANNSSNYVPSKYTKNTIMFGITYTY